MKNRIKYCTLYVLSLLALSSCKPEPPLHLFEAQDMELKIVLADFELNTVWDYEIEYGVQYDWRAEWWYGWDSEDERIFGPIGYTEPNVFNIRRYYTGNTPYSPHTRVISNTIEGTTFQGEFTWGYWDLLVYNDIDIIDGAQSIIFDETTTLDSITASTNQTIKPSRYQAPRYTHSFYEPEALFSAYEQAIDINRNLDGFIYDAERNVYVKKLNMLLLPVTYIYLTQVIVHNNRNKIVGVDGSSNISGFARSCTVNSGRAGSDAITVNYKTRWKPGCEKNGEIVDIAGGRLMTFGMCDQANGRLKNVYEVHDKYPHYMDVTMQFNNGLDSTFVFDVSDQVRRRYKGGVLTVEIDMDTIPVPTRSGGSAFNAIVKDYEEETHEFEM